MTAVESAWLHLQPENLRKKPFETPSPGERSFLLRSLRKKGSVLGDERVHRGHLGQPIPSLTPLRIGYSGYA